VSPAQPGGRIDYVELGTRDLRRFHFIEPGGNQLAVWSEK
jgi:hypothetical protein